MRPSISAASAALCCLVIGWPSAANVLHPSFFHGAKLERACNSQEENSFAVGFCVGYVFGVADTAEGWFKEGGQRFWCWPDGFIVGGVPNPMGVTLTTMAVREYFHKHPEAQKWPGSAVVWEALRENFPCN